MSCGHGCGHGHCPAYGTDCSIPRTGPTIRGSAAATAGAGAGPTSRRTVEALRPREAAAGDPSRRGRARPSFARAAYPGRRASERTATVEVRVMSTLPTVSHEHHDRLHAIADQLHALSDCSDSDCMDTSRLIAARPAIEEIHDGLVTYLIPHMEAVETAVYPVLERLLAQTGSMGVMQHDHAQIRQLTAVIGEFLGPAGRRSPPRDGAPHAAGPAAPLRRPPDASRRGGALRPDHGEPAHGGPGRRDRQGARPRRRPHARHRLMTGVRPIPHTGAGST